MAYVLRAVSLNGDVSFSTGREGAGWCSPDLGQAETFESLTVARRRAKRHNEGTWTHGLRFIAVDKARVLNPDTAD